MTHKLMTTSITDSKSGQQSLKAAALIEATVRKQRNTCHGSLFVMSLGPSSWDYDAEI